MSSHRISSAVLIAKGQGPKAEILLGFRNPAIRFFGGYWAAVGGVLEKEDQEKLGPDGEGLDAALRNCAVREVQEEVGLKLDATKLQHLCDITTPEFTPRRYQTRFYWAQCPEDQSPSLQSDELVDMQFFNASDALERWRSGELEIVPPILLMLNIIEHCQSHEDFCQKILAESKRLENGKLHPVYFSPGIFMAPLKCPTKPPATTTNCLLIGTDQVYIVDPGSQHEDQLAALKQKLDLVIADGASLKAVILTHHHPDHTGGVQEICTHYKLPLLASDECHRRVIEAQRIDAAHEFKSLKEGDEIELGQSPDGKEGWKLEVYESPGHAVGHLAFRENRYGALVAGDMCSAISTIMIDPPEGHLRTYVESLVKLSELDIGTIYPAHGPAVRTGKKMLQHFVHHRKEREDLLIHALSEQAQSIEELLPVVYEDTNEKLYPLAARSLEAGLVKLIEDGLATGDLNHGWKKA